MANNTHSLSPQAQKFLELLIQGRVSEAEKYLDENYDQRVAKLQREWQSISQERGVLFNTLQLTKLNRGNTGTARVVATYSLHTGVSKRDKILACAVDLAKKQDGRVTVQQVVDALAAEHFDLGTDKPNTSVGVTIFKSNEWQREGPAQFRYVGPQLDLGSAR